MTKLIRVHDVSERNNCAGKKFISVTSMEKDETMYSQFRLFPGYMHPHDKLALASVAPMDEVEVIYDSYQQEFLVVGDFTVNHSDVSNRDPLCMCGTRMVSDGFDVYCPNDTCALTLTARIERLANTPFFTPETHEADREVRYFHEQGVSFSNVMNFYKPFLPVLQGMFWGEATGSLEKILLTKNTGVTSLASFLIEPLFQDIVEYLNQPSTFDQNDYGNIFQFYRDMDELINRRDIHSRRQNTLLFGFLYCLGIEALRDDHINLMMNYEMTLDGAMDCMLVYAYFLTHPQEMVRELGIHHLEAVAIFTEVRRRKHELFDIFYHYAHENPDITTAFRDFM